MSHGLGRLPAPDPRDADYPLRTALVTPEDRRWRWYPSMWWGNQFDQPQCVGYAWTHWLEDGPVAQPGIPPIVDPAFLYAAAQKVDEWPGEGYEGTSVRAGAKVLQSMGFISEYRWATSLADIVDAVLHIGPVVVGTNWYSNMFDYELEAPYTNTIDVSGGLAGGHAWLLNGYDEARGVLRGKNSWGRGWGWGGSFMIKMEDVERLLNEDGEACIGFEQAH